jgi:hypothetical protein
VWALAHVEKPDQFMFQLEAPQTWGRKTREVAVPQDELERENTNLRQMAAWAASVQKVAGG